VSHRRFLDYLPVGSYLVLGNADQGGSYSIRMLTAKQVEQRPEDLARWEKKRPEIKKEFAELAKKPKDRDFLQNYKTLSRALGQPRPDDVYEVIAVGENFVELRVKWSPNDPKGRPERGLVLPAARIRDIRLPSETYPQPARST